MIFIQATIIFGAIALGVWGFDYLYNKYGKSKVDEFKNTAELKAKGEDYLNNMYECSNCSVNFRTHQIVLFRQVKGHYACPHCQSLINLPNYTESKLETIKDYQMLNQSLELSTSVLPITDKKTLDTLKYHPSCPYIEGKDINEQLKMYDKIDEGLEEKEINKIWSDYDAKVENKNNWVKNLNETTSQNVIDETQNVIDTVHKNSEQITEKEEIRIKERF